MNTEYNTSAGRSRSGSGCEGGQTIWTPDAFHVMVGSVEANTAWDTGVCLINI
ncbi:hypothetical protein DPMN_054523 [Dreissena polymorpha]|uniref:Uncharacterized protein n=1 Tax=Dreissena polymorpha TaxID=45954 RepID=A0A9D4CNA0_DREPO|nr:hypothetical protein DPMN_054523 [Dreissena polymorpha]